MKIVLQRVKNASVVIDNELYSSINNGFLILFGVQKGDNKDKADWLVNKVLNLRCFSDENGKMNLSVKDIYHKVYNPESGKYENLNYGEILVVSQFTLCADVKKGTRPSFDNAMAPEEADNLYKYFVNKLIEQNMPVKTGVFGAHMEVNLLNDGPVTFIIEAP